MARIGGTKEEGKIATPRTTKLRETSAREMAEISARDQVSC
jgi:hypothetical protein